MKKNIFRALALALLMLPGISSMQAQQRSYNCPPLSPELQQMADEVIQLNIDDPEKANKSFMKLAKKIKGNKEDLLAVGTYFLEHDNYPGASQCARQIYETAPDYVPGLMFSGEVYMKAQNWGSAGQKFDEVLAIDSTNVAALKRNAFVYKNVNPHVAIDALNKIKRIEPAYIEADKDLGDIYYKLSDYKQAIEHYATYYKAAPKDQTLDIRSCENYLQSLYSQADFATITQLTSELLPLQPNDLIIRRMDFFAKVNKIGEAMDYDAAVKAAEDASAYLADKQYADSIFIYLDYEYAAALSKEKGDIPGAIEWYKKALAKDPTKASGYKELSTLYARNKQAEEGIAAFQKYLDMMGDKADISDRFLLGTKYMAAQQQADTPADKKAEYFQKADAIFKEVMEKKPDYVPAIVFSARLNNTDSQKPLPAVRDLYQKVLEVSNDDADKYKNYRFEACRYLFFYAVSVEPVDKAGAKKAYDMAKAMDPENDFVANAGKYLKQLGL